MSCGVARGPGWKQGSPPPTGAELGGRDEGSQAAVTGSQAAAEMLQPGRSSRPGLRGQGGLPGHRNLGGGTESRRPSRTGAVGREDAPLRAAHVHGPGRPEHSATPGWRGPRPGRQQGPGGKALPASAPPPGGLPPRIPSASKCPPPPGRRSWIQDFIST